jgi:hypothetical protein
MAALQDSMGPHGWADIAKDFAIMIVVSALIIAGVMVLKQVVPPLA